MATLAGAETRAVDIACGALRLNRAILSAQIFHFLQRPILRGKYKKIKGLCGKSEGFSRVAGFDGKSEGFPENKESKPGGLL